MTSETGGSGGSANKSLLPAEATLPSTSHCSTDTASDGSCKTEVCRYCHDGFSSSKGDLDRPCACSGTTAYIHSQCLLQSRLKNINLQKSYCELCRSKWLLPSTKWVLSESRWRASKKAADEECLSADAQARRMFDTIKTITAVCVLVLIFASVCLLAINALPAPATTKHIGLAVHGALVVLMLLCIAKFCWLFAKYWRMHTSQQQHTASQVLTLNDATGGASNPATTDQLLPPV